MGRKKFFNFKNLFLVSFLAVAGIFSAGAFVVNQYTNNQNSIRNAEADSTSTYYFVNNQSWSSVYMHNWGSSGTTWPGQVMTNLSLSNSNYPIYKADLKNASNNQIVFNNGSGTQTVDLTKDGTGKRLFIITGQNGEGKKTGSWIQGNPSIRKRFYYLNTSSWGNVYCYGFQKSGDQEINNKWPGVKMTKTDTSIGGKYVYYVDLPEIYTTFVFNKGDSGGQTADINYTIASDNRYCDGSNFKNDWNCYSIQYRFNNTGSWTALSERVDIDGCLATFRSSNVSQTFNDVLYLQYKVPNGSYTAIGQSSMGVVGNNGANNFTTNNGTTRPTIRYNGVTGKIEVRVTGSIASPHFYTWAKGINDDNYESYDIIRTNTSNVKDILNVTFQGGEGDNRSWGKTDVDLKENETLVLFREQSIDDDTGAEYAVQVLDVGENEPGVSSGGIEKVGSTVTVTKTGKFNLYINHTYGGFDKLYSLRTTRVVTYDMNGHGTQIDPNYYVYYNTKFTAPTAPTATGYTFGGWYKEKACTNAWNFATDTVTDDTILYAKWTTNQYRLTLTMSEGVSKIYYKINGAANFSYVTSTTNLNVNYDSTYYLYAEATTGYTLNSPYNSYNSSNPYYTTKTESTQSWAPTATINTYTVTIDVNQAEYGTVSQSSVVSVPYGTTISKSNNTVTINGTIVTATPTAATAQYTYAFSSWTNGTATVTGPLTVTANFTRTTNNYTVSFNVQGHGSAPEDQSIAYGNKVTKPSDPSATGYTFGGWYKESSCTNAWNFNSDIVTGATELFAKWTAATYDVSFDNGGGKGGGISASSYTYKPSASSSITITAPTKAGYNPSYTITRTGDYGGTAPSVNGTTVTIPAGSYGTFTINTTWTARTTTITLNPNGGIAGTTEVTATYGSLMPGIEVLPTKTGYNFLGFFDTDKPTGGTKYYNSTGTAAGYWDKDVATSTLYARWAETSYYVEYVGNEPSGTATDIPEDDYWTYDHDSTLGSAPSLTGYTFTGWYSDAACQNRLGDADQLIHNANLSSDGSKAYIYAGWAVSECTVTITVNDSRYGSVDKLSISNVPLGSSVAINGNKITIAGTTVTASTKTAPDGYNNSFTEWTNAPATITGAVTITATFTQISGETAAIAFATNFNTRVGGICVYAGGTNFNTLKTEWNGTQQTAYNNLEDYQKYWLDKNHASSDDNVQDMFAMYDYIAHKYGTGSGDDKLHDFLNRNNGAQAAAVNNFSPFDYFTNDKNNLSTLIIVIASSISLLSITALSVLMVKKRKRKEQ